MQKQNPCDYKFEIIRVGGRNFRVPLIDNQSAGKVIETSTHALQQKSQEV